MMSGPVVLMLRHFSQVLVCSRLVFCAQTGSGETKGIDSGDYSIQQSIEAGYRGNWINGNLDNYDTFVNLGLRPSSVRLHA